MEVAGLCFFRGLGYDYIILEDGSGTLHWRSKDIPLVKVCDDLK